MLGFNTLRDLIGHEIVGACLENEHHNPIGDSVQQTTGGLLVWRKADNWTAFTDGYRTWINGPNGLVQRLNTERFTWEDENTFRAALEALQKTPFGRAQFALLTESAPTLSFGNVRRGWSSRYYDPPRNEIVLNRAFRSESADALAAIIAWNTVLAANAMRYGPQHVRWQTGAD